MTIAFMALAVFFTWLSFSRKEILICFCASLTWFSLAIWYFFGSTPLFGLEEVYHQLLVWVFVLMTFVPWLAQMNTEITREAGGQKWTEYGPKPKTKIANYEEYKAELRRRLGR